MEYEISIKNVNIKFSVPDAFLEKSPSNTLNVKRLETQTI
jgi:hypothetical protein